MGDLIERKNYSVAIQAVSEAQNDKLHYFICGEGAQESHLRSVAEQLNVTRQIHFLGFRADIKELLVASDIFIFTTKQEGLPRSMMEAMASGLPCVASKIRGNTDLLENAEGGFLCDPQDASEFAEKLNLLAANTALRETMGRNNLIAIQQFSTEAVIKEMQNIYAAELVNN
jgi:glycosyltransferase involved in cell wall biosynthesis